MAAMFVVLELKRTCGGTRDWIRLSGWRLRRGEPEFGIETDEGVEVGGVDNWTFWRA